MGKPRPSRGRVLALVAATVIVLAADVTTAAVRHDRAHDRPQTRQSAPPGHTGRAPAPAGPTATPSPTAAQPSVSAATTVTLAYYDDLARRDVRGAYSLLCGRDQQGYAAYATEVALDDRTGTGIRSITPAGTGIARSGQAAVPARIVLANGQQTPIVVLLLAEAGRWRVCSSNLGGILPGPGPTRSSRPSPGATVNA